MQPRILLAVFGLALAGCHSNGWRDNDSDSSVGAAPGRSSALSEDDTEFVEKAALGGMFEVESSRLAVSRSRNEQVRDFANMMIADHGKANRELDTLVHDKGATLPRMLDSAHDKRLDDLRDLQGAEFDREYHQLQLGGHDDAIELFEKASRQCDDPDLRAFASKTLPVLRKHRTELMENETAFLGSAK